MDLAAALNTGLGVFSNANAVNVAVVLKVGDGRGDRTDSCSGCGSGTGKVSSKSFGGKFISGISMSASGTNAVGLVLAIS